MINKIFNKVRRDGIRSLPHAAVNRISFGSYATWMQTKMLYTRSVVVGNINYRGVRLSTTKPIARQNMSRFVRGAYENREADLIDEYISSERPVLELGGGLGFVTAYTGKKLDTEMEMEVMEANPELIPLIRKTVELNDVQAQIRHAAYNPDGDETEIMLSNDFLASSTVRSNENGKTIPVSGYSLTDLLDSDSIDPVTLIIDIEGAEFELLDSSEECRRMSDRCPLVIVEMHKFAGDTESAIETFIDLGYTHAAARGNVHVFEQEGKN